uniref:Putative secreted protein n=1 Tax=Rhipicephalus microplus TaxID=6941 RepID=A0A6M2DE50_RHIMP
MLSAPPPLFFVISLFIILFVPKMGDNNSACRFDLWPQNLPMLIAMGKSITATNFKKSIGPPLQRLSTKSPPLHRF